MMKEHFPLLSSGVVYLDNAATTQKPSVVIDRLASFYRLNNANPQRGVYDLSVNATLELENSRKIVAEFIGANSSEIFFTKNATEGFNVLANSINKLFKKNHIEGNIVVSILEHHSNFLPWKYLADDLNLKFDVADHNSVEDNILSLVDDKTKIVSFTLMSNVSGRIIDAEDLIKKIRSKNKDCIIVVDAAQAIAHMDVDVKRLDCDFLVFSAHKMYGPLGVGVVFGKEVLLESLDPVLFGGGMVLDYKEGEFSFNESPLKFEAGTLDVAGISAFGVAINFFKSMKNKFDIEKKLQNFAIYQLKKIEGVTILGHKSDNFGPVISFTIDGVHPHDFASIASSFDVCIRAGHHCAKPYLDALNISAISRLSLAFYNDESDILKLIKSIKKAKEVFR